MVTRTVLIATILIVSIAAIHGGEHEIPRTIILETPGSACRTEHAEHSDWVSEEFPVPSEAQLIAVVGQGDISWPLAIPRRVYECKVGWRKEGGSQYYFAARLDNPSDSQVSTRWYNYGYFEEFHDPADHPPELKFTPVFGDFFRVFCHTELWQNRGVSCRNNFYAYFDGRELLGSEYANREDAHQVVITLVPENEGYPGDSDSTPLVMQRR